MQTVLVVDDEKGTRDLMVRALAMRWRTLGAADAEAALRMIEEDPGICVVLSDIRMPGASGMELLREVKRIRPQMVVILITAYGSVADAVAAVKDGADDFLVKPIDLDALEKRVEKAIAQILLEKEVHELRSQVNEKYGMENITGESPAMKNVFALVRQAAPTEATILIEGPSGTGKELVAHAIHNLSARAKGPFVAVECAALTGSLLESELFGHEKGAFTDAFQRRIGRFEAANHGTIFLDEISEISPATQVKLLRVLETRTFERVGGTETIKTDIRIVAACNKPLAKLVAEGKFREDLYYRLNVVDIRLPALRERTGDIPLIAMRYLREFSKANGSKVQGIAPEAMKILESYSWPGNVRELRNTIEKMVVLARNPELGVDDVPEQIRYHLKELAVDTGGGTLEALEKRRIAQAIAQAGGNRTKAAERLGISRRTLYRKIEEYAQEGVEL
ncbi:MAG: sigma-54-dependent Fis family transcriptional regulator [Kiritimatiellae bacterium]|nr:sigma-54-dependent Fis family transcriptional regulator [Kiritimatiellia bacterium]